MTNPSPFSPEKLEHIFYGAGLDRSPPSTRLPRNQEVFERRVIEAIAKENPAIGQTVLAQFDHASIDERWGSGAGFKTYFRCPAGVPLLPDKTEYPLSTSYLLRDVVHPETQESFWTGIPKEHRESGRCGALLFHEGGCITYLDCHNYKAGWPDEEYVFWFLSGDCS